MKTESEISLWNYLRRRGRTTQARTAIGWISGRFIQAWMLLLWWILLLMLML